MGRSHIVAVGLFFLHSQALAVSDSVKTKPNICQNRACLGESTSDLEARGARGDRKRFEGRVTFSEVAAVRFFLSVGMIWLRSSFFCLSQGRGVHFLPFFVSSVPSVLLVL